MQNNLKRHSIKRGETLSLIANQNKISVSRLLAHNPKFKPNPNQISVGDVVYIPEKKKAKSFTANITPPPPPKIKEKKKIEKPNNYFVVPEGQLTFDAEGMEVEGPYFSRILHVPGPWSGATIGRGYDMKERSDNEIFDDMTAAGVPKTKAKKLASCSGYQGKRAKDFIKQKDFETLRINPKQQWTLFNTVYEELEADVIRICHKHDVIAKYGTTDWEGLDAKLRDIAIDLRYRGDYTPATRQKVQPLLVKNDHQGLAELINNRDYWVKRFGVPVDRFKRRKRYVAAKIDH